jgi:hypothetical protein
MKSPSVSKNDDFLAPAIRAFRRVAVRIRSDNARLNLPLIVGKHGRLMRVKVGSKSASAA